MCTCDSLLPCCSRPPCVGTFSAPGELGHAPTPSRDRRSTSRGTSRTSRRPYGRITGPGGQLAQPGVPPGARRSSRPSMDVAQLLQQVATPDAAGAHGRQRVPGLERRQPAARRLERHPRHLAEGRLHQPVRRAPARHRLPRRWHGARDPYTGQAAAGPLPRRRDHAGLGAGLGGDVRLAGPGPRRARLRGAHLRRAGPGHQRDAPPRDGQRAAVLQPVRARRGDGEMFGCPGVPFQQLSNFVVGTEDAIDFFTSTAAAPLRQPRLGRRAGRRAQPVRVVVRPQHGRERRDAGPPTKLAIIGHSMGAAAVSKVQATDRRVAAVVALDKLAGERLVRPRRGRPTQPAGGPGARRSSRSTASPSRRTC